MFISAHLGGPVSFIISIRPSQAPYSTRAPSSTREHAKVKKARNKVTIVGLIVIVISTFLERHYVAMRRAPAYSRALRLTEIHVAYRGLAKEAGFRRTSIDI